MYSIQPQSLTDNDLLRVARDTLLMDLGNGLPLAWQVEILRRLEMKLSAGAAPATTDPRQLTLF